VPGFDPPGRGGEDELGVVLRADRPSGPVFGADGRLLELSAHRKTAPGDHGGLLDGGVEAGHEADGVDRFMPGEVVQDLLGTAEDGREGCTRGY
jgi:hypothetical protein